VRLKGIAPIISKLSRQAGWIWLQVGCWVSYFKYLQVEPTSFTERKAKRTK
jgi:hypothetical protein